MRVSIRNRDKFASFLQERYSGIETVEPAGITIDSREVEKGDIFVALRGEQTDGHRFIPQAIQAGASLVFSEEAFKSSIPVIVVPSTTELLLYLAEKWWKKYTGPVIAITGTNGKTTTKDLLVHILSGSVNLSFMDGNYNSTIGLPVSLFGMDLDSDMAIVELGTSSLGEIKKLCRVTRPNMGLITNISAAHLEYLGSIENVAMEKSAVFHYLPDTGKAFVNADDPYIRQMETYAEKITFGFSPGVDFQGEFSRENGRSVLKVNGNPLQMPFGGMIMAKNTLSVYSIAVTLGISHRIFQERLNSFQLPEGRGNILTRNNITVVNDAYNANLLSAKEGIRQFLDDFPGVRHILILGDMFELGEEAAQYHRELGDFIAGQSPDEVFLLGDLMYNAADACSAGGILCRHFKNPDDLIEAVKKTLKPGDAVYVKGSRGMKMETVIEKGIFS